MDTPSRSLDVSADAASEHPADSCELCGALPARRFVVRRNVSLLILLRMLKVDARLCRVHALALLRRALGKTIWQGWLGTGIFGLNAFQICADLFHIARALSLPAPVPRPTGTVTFVEHELRLIDVGVTTPTRIRHEVELRID
jgi:hypothetical protein